MFSIQVPYGLSPSGQKAFQTEAISLSKSAQRNEAAVLILDVI